MRSSLFFTGAILLGMACAQTETPHAARMTPAAPSASQAELPRNHYKGWMLEQPVAFPTIVTLTDPRSTITRRVELENIAYLFNPATKHHHGEHGTQSNAVHYAAYTIRNVWNPGSFSFQNQFGRTTWTFSDRDSWLLVPARMTPPSGPPWGGDHLLCFAASGAKYPATDVTVMDSMSAPPLPIGSLEPSHFCVPVSKQWKDNPIEPVTQPRAYLTIYKYKLAEKHSGGDVWDQFHTASPAHLGQMQSERLAVPAWD